MDYYRHSREHLFDEIRRLDLVLNLHIERQRHDPAHANFDEFRGLFISEDEVDRLLEGKRERARGNAQHEAEIKTLVNSIVQLEQQIAARAARSLAHGVALALPRLAQLFQLDAFDVNALLVCVVPELDIKYEKLYAYLQNDITRKRPSANLILSLFCRTLAEKIEARERLLGASPLVANRLISYAEANNEQPSLLARHLVIDERILNFILDVDAPDEQLVLFTTQITPQATPEQLRLPADAKESLIRFFQSQVGAMLANERARARVFLYDGPAGVGKKFTAEALCKMAGINLLVADMPRLLAQGPNIQTLLPRLLREARLRSAALFLDHSEVLLGESERETNARNTLFNSLKDFAGIVFVGSREVWQTNADDASAMFVRVQLPTPDYSTRKQIWDDFLTEAEHAIAADVSTDALADKFSFTPGKIRAAITEAGQRASMRDPDAGEISAEDFYQACRAQSSRKLSTLARKITPLYTWRDIVLPNDSLEHLREVCTHIKHRQMVFGEWGFNEKISLGKGLSTLFVGPSGTGKTMAAEILARELNLDLYKIDLSSIVSKYIGETEKNLSKIFAEAEQSNAILFFDEADSIFGKRSEVKDAHDRYANIEVNYLLQRMEEYEGIVILASNFQKNIDEAFTRRIRFIIEFPFPDADYRRRIWKKVFPRETPLDEHIDFDFLSQKMKLTGGNIKNIALNAAFLAAENSGHVEMEHIICATKREFQKMGRMCVRSDFEQYFELIEKDSARSLSSRASD